jgi:hypothetical protein
MEKLSIVVLMLCLLALTACSGGGGGTPDSSVSGVASKGIIRNGTIKVYALNADGSKGALLKETVTDNNGAYRAELGSYRGAILVEASGSYTDEATGSTKTIAPDAPLRAALENPSGSATLAVTPLTEMAVQRGEDALSHRIRIAEIAANNALIATAFKVDITGTLPVDALAATPAATQAQKEYALLLAAFSGLMQSRGKDLPAVIADIRASLGADNRLTVPLAAQLQAALAGFAASGVNRTGISDVSATPLITIGGNTRPLIISVAGATSPLAGIELLVTLPPGVTVKSDAKGILPGSSLQASGSALGSALIAGSYTPATAAMRGKVKLALISTTGFSAGAFATLQCDVAPDAVPLAGDFSLTLLDAVDSQKNPLTGLSLSAQLGE